MSARILLALMLSLPAFAFAEENEDLAELVKPTRSIELGVSSTHGTRPAYSEFFGLGRQASGLMANIDLRGAAAHDSEDAMRWRFLANDLGLALPRVTGEFGEQGRYRLNFGYAESPTLNSDTWRTPLLGAGTTRLMLPAGFTARTATGPSALPALSSVFSNFNIGTRRTRSDLAFQANPAESWQLKASYRHELKQGSKVTGTVAGRASGAAMLLPEPIHNTTEQFGLSLGYAANRQHLQLAYSGSLFRNDIAATAYQNPFSTGVLENRLGSAPDNQFHQLKLDGATYFSKTTRLSGSVSYGRLMQNQNFLPFSTNPVVTPLPQTSLHGRVVTESVNLKLLSRPWRDLGLLAAWRYDERDNRTPVNSYARSNYETGSLSTQRNTPYSRARSKATLEADYLVRSGSNLTFGLEREALRRYCRDATAACVEVERSTETALRGEWRQAFNDRLSGKLAYSQAARRSDDPYHLSGPAVEAAGMRKFLYANRDRQQWRSSLTFLLGEAWSLNARVDLNDDNYADSSIGLRNANSRVGNIDIAYTIDEDFSVYAFYSREEIRSRLNNRTWSATTNDGVDAVGLGVKHAGLYSGKLELSADLIFVRARSSYSVAGTLPGGLPDVSSRQVMLQGEARYELDKASSLRLTGQFNRVRSRDYAYDAIAETSSSRVLGTGEAPLNINGHFLGLSYIFRFR